MTTDTAPIEEQPPVKAKRKYKKKLKHPKLLTKRQKELMLILDAGGFAQLKKAMNDAIRYQVLDEKINPISFIDRRTITALIKKERIYKAIDGKYYSVNFYKDNDAKPVPVTNGNIIQAEFKGKNFKQRSTRSGDSIGRTNPAGPGIDANAAVHAWVYQL